MRPALLILLLSAPLFSGAPANPGSHRREWEILRSGLADGNPDKRRQAIAAIASMGATPEVLHYLSFALRDRSTLVRQTAATALGHLKTRKAIPYLKEALDDNSEVAFTAAKALADLGDNSGDGLFMEVIKGERTNSPGMVKRAVRDAKAKIRNPESLAMMGFQEASGALLGPASMGIVVAEDALKDKGAPGRVIAAGYLAKDPDPYALTLLEWALGDSNWAVRAAAAKAVGERGNAASIAKLEPLLADSHDAVQYMAAAAIIRLSKQDHAGSYGHSATD